MLALIVYVGGIYPYPHTLDGALALRDRARRRRRARGGRWRCFSSPLVTSIGLAAPKLLPVLATMSRFPRLIESDEPCRCTRVWVMLTARQQGFDFYPHLPLRVFWVWWEWGAYVGVAGVLALVRRAGRRLDAAPGGAQGRRALLRRAVARAVDLAAGPPPAALQLAAPAGADPVPGHPAAGAGPGRRRRRALGALRAAPRRWAEAAALAIVCLYGIRPGVDLPAGDRRAVPPRRFRRSRRAPPSSRRSSSTTATASRPSDRSCAIATSGRPRSSTRRCSPTPGWSPATASRPRPRATSSAATSPAIAGSPFSPAARAAPR